MGHIRVNLPNTNNKLDGFELVNVDTICTLTRHEHDTSTRIITLNFSYSVYVDLNKRGKCG